MSTTEDILYAAHAEGLRTEVFKILKEIGGKPEWKHKEPSDKFSYALELARIRKAGSNPRNKS